MTIPYHKEPGASQGNAFTAHLDGKRSMFCKDTPRSVLRETSVREYKKRGPAMVINNRKADAAGRTPAPAEPVRATPKPSNSSIKTVWVESK